MSRGNEQEQRQSSYPDFLPALFSQGETGAFLRKFLLAFEHILSGLGTIQMREDGMPGQDAERASVVGLEEIIQGATDPETGAEMRGIHRFYDPGAVDPQYIPTALEDVVRFWETQRLNRAPKEFLGWLAGWVALSYRAVDEERWRRFIDRAVDLYRNRGTKSSMAQLISIYTGQVATIDETSRAFQIGRSALGADERTDEVRQGTWLSSRIGGLPFVFFVSAQLNASDLAVETEHRKMIERIVEMEKPAHTTAVLRIIGTINMTIGDPEIVGYDPEELHATVGLDTFISSQIL